MVIPEGPTQGVEINSDDYHDYVFRDGKLIGEFEQMYQKSAEVPWRQDRIREEIDVHILKALLRFQMPYPTILDVGCGVGYFANELRELGTQIYGIDVSPTAIQKLMQNFPQIEARVVDITRPIAGPLFPNRGTFSLVVCRGLFWYVFPHIVQVVRNISSWVMPGGHLAVHQNFPPLNSQFVGKDVIPSPERLLEYFLNTDGFVLVQVNHFSDRTKGKGNDDWSTFMLKKGGSD